MSRVAIGQLLLSGGWNPLVLQGSASWRWPVNGLYLKSLGNLNLSD
jgi:hypothetical protein